MVGSGALTEHRLVGVDTSLFIHAFERHAVFGERSAAILRSIEVRRPSVVASTRLIAELLVAPFTTGRLELVDEYVDRLSVLPNLRLIPPDVAICRTAARLRAERRALRLPDAIHLATAIESKASAFVTNDRNLGEGRELTILRVSALT